MAVLWSAMGNLHHLVGISTSHGLRLRLQGRRKTALTDSSTFGDDFLLAFLPLYPLYLFLLIPVEISLPSPSLLSPQKQRKNTSIYIIPPLFFNSTEDFKSQTTPATSFPFSLFPFRIEISNPLASLSEDQSSITKKYSKVRPSTLLPSCFFLLQASINLTLFTTTTNQPQPPATVVSSHTFSNSSCYKSIYTVYTFSEYSVVVIVE